MDGAAIPHLLGGVLADAHELGERLDAAKVMDQRTKCLWFRAHRHFTYRNSKACASTFRTVTGDMLQIMSDAAERLRALRIKKGFANPIDAARAYGWNEHTYKAHENGLRGIRLDAARKYAAAYGSTPAHILGIGTNGAGATEKRPVNQVVHVPVIARVSAGTFRYDEPIDYEGEAVPAVPRADIGNASQYSVIVDGPSVNKRIPDGAFAICVPLDEYPGGAQHGQLVHVVRERAGLFENTIKEIRFGQGGTTLVPVSTDPRYQEPVQLSSGDDGEIVRIQGIVIGAYISV